MSVRYPFLALLLSAFVASASSQTAPAVGPFFEPDQPFFHSQVELTPPPEGQMTGGNFVVRGIVLPLPSGHVVVFDQELLRVAGIWARDEGEPPITPKTMAQISYEVKTRKAGGDHPLPTGPLLLTTGMHPGVASDLAGLSHDPRPPKPEGDEGRGALAASFARYDGLELAGANALLHYTSGTTRIREWFESRVENGVTTILRHLEVAPHAQPLHVVVGGRSSVAWTTDATGATLPGTESTAAIRALANSPEVSFREHEGELVATLAPSSREQRVTLALVFGDAASATTPKLAATPPAPSAPKERRWPQTVTAPVQVDSIEQNGLVLDRIAVPENNPWNRRVRSSDLAFLSEDRAAVITYDGDVWIVDGLAAAMPKEYSWQRFASGLHEPLAIAAPQGKIQVATKNGVVRLHDRDGNGEADWFENFNDQMIQSQTTRSFPLDMAIGPDGSTYVPQGGIVTQSGLVSGGMGTLHTGGILKISPDGRSSETYATGAREPFLTVHPETGVVTATDQQGHYIPSSVAYLVRSGDDFGFMVEKPTKLTPPLVWIPHDQDASSSSQVWMLGQGMGPWNGKLLHLSYGTGRIFLITPDLDAPTPQGAVIPLELRTDLPLLHARMHPRGDSVILAGFQIWGTRVTTNWALARLRSGKTPIVTPLAARTVKNGVALEFASPLDPASITAENVAARAWNYKRSSAYGSGRYTLDGSSGTLPWPVGQAVLSSDRKSVFIHLPELPPVMQLEVRHDFRLADGTVARGVTFYTIHEHHDVDLAQLGFPKVDFSKSVSVVKVEKVEPPTVAMGKALAENLGCLACHSIDGSMEGKIGPTWKRLFGAKRTFVDGTSDVADELYLREKILDPLNRRVSLAQAEMPSYRGVLNEQQLESLILYIKSIR